MNLTLYANWTAIQYKITYMLDGGTNNKDNVSKYTVEDEITLYNASKTGYTFNGWFTDDKFTSTVVESIVKGSHGDIVLYANFVINK